MPHAARRTPHAARHVPRATRTPHLLQPSLDGRGGRVAGQLQQRRERRRVGAERGAGADVKQIPHPHEGLAQRLVRRARRLRRRACRAH